MKREFPDPWEFSIEKLAHPYEYFNKIEDYHKLVKKLKKEDFFSKLKNACPDDSEIERNNQIINLFDIKNGENLYLKTVIVMLVHVLQKFINVSTKEHGINPLVCIPICSYTYQCELYHTIIFTKNVMENSATMQILTFFQNCRSVYAEPTPNPSSRLT